MIEMQQFKQVKDRNAKKSMIEKARMKKFLSHWMKKFLTVTGQEIAMQDNSMKKVWIQKVSGIENLLS